MINLIFDYSVLLWIAVPVYWLSWRSLLGTALDSHAAKVRSGGDSEEYPLMYYIALMGQLIPLCLLGLARLDEFIIGTRIPLLVLVALTYVIVTDKDGVFSKEEYLTPAIRVLIGISVFFMIFIKSGAYELLVEYSVEYGYFMMGVMLLYMIFGQGATLLKLWRNYRAGKPRIVGLQLQILRCTGFGLPAVHYGMEFGVVDSLFVVNLLGASGALAMIIVYLITPEK